MANTDIKDIQDRIGYVDTGSSSQSNRNMDTSHPPVVTSSTSHITIKEPKPLRQVQIITNNNQEAKKRQSNNNKPPLETNNNKPSYHIPQQLPKPIIRKSNSMETGNYHLNVPPPPPPATTTTTTNYYNDSNNNKRSPTENKTPFVNYPTSSAPNMTGTNNEEIKERMVHKLYELADMLNSLNIKDHVFDESRMYFQQQQQQGPKPTPSKSDPSHLPYYQPQPIRRTGSNNRKKYMPSSPETNRQQYNKSADNYQDHGSARPAYHYDDYYYPSYYDPPRQLPPQDMMYNEYYMDEPYQYAPPLPPQQQTRPIYGRPRRKSYTNLHDEEILQQHRLSRKGSRGNLNRHSRQPPPPQAMYDPYQQQPQQQPNPRYHYYPPHPQYSPDLPYYH